jgi:putative oxidoreductase
MTPKVLQRFLFGGPRLTSWPAEFALLILRLTAGLCLALNHGISKIPVKPELVAGVQSAGFPLPTTSAWMAALGEFVGGLLLAAGLFTRAAALWVAGVMGGAAFVVHRRSFTGEAAFSDTEMAVLYLAIAIAFIGTGSSRTGLDQLIWRRYVLSGPDAELASFERRRDALEQATRRAR